MPDREKVIKGLELCVTDYLTQANCKICPYGKGEDTGYCWVEMNTDALALLQEQDDAIEKADSMLKIAEDKIKELLKEQEAVFAHWDDDTGHWIEGDRNGIDPHTRTTGEMIDTFRCSWCGFYQYWKTPFCPNCGAKMEGR